MIHKIPPTVLFEDHTYEILLEQEIVQFLCEVYVRKSRAKTISPEKYRAIVRTAHDPKVKKVLVGIGEPDLLKKPGKFEKLPEGSAETHDEDE